MEAGVWLRPGFYSVNKLMSPGTVTNAFPAEGLASFAGPAHDTARQKRP